QHARTARGRRARGSGGGRARGRLPQHLAARRRAALRDVGDLRRALPRLPGLGAAEPRARRRARRRVRRRDAGPVGARAPAAPLLAPIVLLARGITVRERLLRLGAGTLVALVLVAPWIGYNLSRFSHLVPASEGGAGTVAGAGLGVIAVSRITGFLVPT